MLSEYPFPNVALPGYVVSEQAYSMTTTYDPADPEWWLARLLPRLQAQAKNCAVYERFYSGIQPLSFASEKFRETMGTRYPGLIANFMPLVVDAEAERLIVQGFRFGTNSADASAWQIWQRNQLDAESLIAHETALYCGYSFAMVAPAPDGPLVTIEDPQEVVVENAPGNRRQRAAALKAWKDPEGYVRATLYLPDEIYKWRSDKAYTETSWDVQNIRFQRFTPEGETWPGVNPLGAVPVVPLLNKPTRNGEGRSEIEPVIGNQNAINKLRFDALVASEYAAFPQRWATNIEVPVDEQTGRELAPFRPGVDNLWVARRPTPEQLAEYGTSFPAPSFGQFSVADLHPYIDMIGTEVGEMASISRTPYHYLLGQPTSVPPSGESLKSSEAPLVRKVVRQSVYFGEGWEEVIRLALVLIGQPKKAKADAETIWSDPETRNEATRADTLVKLQAVGVPDEILWELAGMSPQQIERVKKIKSAEPAAPPPPPAPAPGG